MQQPYLYFHRLDVRLSFCLSALIYLMLDSFYSLDKLVLSNKHRTWWIRQKKTKNKKKSTSGFSLPVKPDASHR